MPDAYDWSRFSVHMYYRASLDDVFRAWATPRGLASFFIAQATHVSPDGSPRTADEITRAGDTYTWRWLHDFSLTGQVLACEPKQHVAYTFGGPMRIDITVTAHDSEQVEVRLEQTGCAREDPDRAWSHLNCRSCWVYFMTNLKSVLEHGIDLRDHVQPHLNDSVSIGWSHA